MQAEIYYVGVVSFISLFENKKEFTRTFSQLRDMSAEELRASPLVKAHTMSILHVVEQLVNRIDNVDKWDKIVVNLAARHIGHDAKSYLAKVSITARTCM